MLKYEYRALELNKSINDLTFIFGPAAEARCYKPLHIVKTLLWCTMVLFV